MQINDFLPYPSQNGYYQEVEWQLHAGKDVRTWMFFMDGGQANQDSHCGTQYGVLSEN